MNDLLKIIKIYFFEQNPNYILELLLKKDYRNILSPKYTKETERLYTSEFYDISTDQISARNRNVFSKFSKLDYFSKTNSNIFFLIESFAQENLTLINSIPCVKFANLFDWHRLSLFLGEDLFTTSKLAFSDYSENCRISNNFSWNEIISHDNNKINTLFEEEISELHFHLKGSSANFIFNWLSLMNDVKGRVSTFKKLKKKVSSQVLIKDGEQVSSTEINILKAAIIRLSLFLYIKDSSSFMKTENMLYKILSTDSVLEILGFSDYIQNQINATKLLYQKNIKCLDYAGKTQDDYLSGERYIFYNLFYKIFSQEISNNSIGCLFYLYILYQNKLRAELIQSNNVVGFDNFNTYERRKELFIKENSLYDDLLGSSAIYSFCQKKNRNLEARIVPKNSKKGIQLSIQKIDKHFEQSITTEDKLNLIQSSPSYINQLNNQKLISQLSNKKELGNRSSYNYIMHFIKKEPIEERKKLYGLVPNNYFVRNEVKKQAIAINQTITAFSRNHETNRIVGIDAANSEINCRPEIFAQAFRFLKTSCGRTYHVGEDFYDLIDGLRAIDEVLIYMNFESGDRLGHALALGINAKDYYEKYNYTIVIPQGILLDNFIWLYMKLKNPISILEKNIHRLYQKIYDSELISIYTYYQSWLLRGDNPNSNKNTCNSLLDFGWYNYDLNRNQEVNDARMNNEAVSLYNRYHFDEKVKNNYKEIETFHFDDELIDSITEIQNALLQKINEKDIFVETNPTSNLRIGGFTKYKDHPLFRFYNANLKNTNYSENKTALSINTDDLGVFATSLEREYSLMALSAIVDYNNSFDDTYDWLNKIRTMSNQYKFVK